MNVAKELDAIAAQLGDSDVLGVQIKRAAATIRQREREAVAYVDHDFLDDHIVACDATKERRADNDLALYAAQPPAAVDAVLKDAARWRKIETLWFLGDVELSTDENGQFLINIDPAEHAAQGWSGIDQGAAIDAALAANAPETRP